MADKGALGYAAKVLHIPTYKVKALSKLILNSLDDIKVTKDNKELIELAKNFKGIISNASVHPSAVVVFPSDPTKFCAIEKLKDTYLTGYEFHELEALGLAKVDVLGLKNLDIIQDTLTLLADKGIMVDIDKIPLNDEKTAKALCDVDVDGLFQIESGIMKSVVKGIKPTCFDDLIPIVALTRPACLANGIPDEYIKERRRQLETKETNNHVE